MAGANVVQISGDNWKAEVLDSKIPVVVDFWATWCGPCKRVAPIIDELATELAGKVKFAKVDVDTNQALAAQFSIRSVPTLLVFQNGDVKEQMPGAASKPALQAKLAEYV